jgi:outer membrane biosynthesis protein TonB
MENYCCELRQHIKKNYIPITHNSVGTAEFHIVIDRGGDILLLEQICSSGDVLLDAIARKTLENSFPFKEFPKEYLSSYMDLIFPINFNIKD